VGVLIHKGDLERVQSILHQYVYEIKPLPKTALRERVDKGEEILEKTMVSSTRFRLI